MSGVKEQAQVEARLHPVPGLRRGKPAGFAPAAKQDR